METPVDGKGTMMTLCHSSRSQFRHQSVDQSTNRTSINQLIPPVDRPPTRHEADADLEPTPNRSPSSAQLEAPEAAAIISRPSRTAVLVRSTANHAHHHGAAAELRERVESADVPPALHASAAAASDEGTTGSLVDEEVSE